MKFNQWGLYGAGIFFILNLMGVFVTFNLISIFGDIFIIGSTPIILLSSIVFSLIGYGLGVLAYKIIK